MPSDGLTTTDSDISGGTTAGDEPSATEPEPDYIVIQSIGSDGSWTDSYRVDYQTAKTLVTNANQEAIGEQVAAFQGFVADYQAIQPVQMTFLLVLVVGVFAVLGSVAVRTLVKSFEVR